MVSNADDCWKLTNTENVNDKMRASGWDVIDIEDGNHDIVGIVNALERARRAEKPTFVNVRTMIGLGSKVAGTAAAHGAAFGSPDVADMKLAEGFNPNEQFVIGDQVRHFFQELPARGQRWLDEWNQLLKGYDQAHPELAVRFRRRMAGEIPTDWKDLIPKAGSFPDKAMATRASNGLCLNPLAERIDSFIVGTADLSPSVHMAWPGKTDFQHPDLRTDCGINGNYGGRYIHYGIREHAMAAISNGLAAYARGTFIPVTSSFFMFYLYAAPAVRMGESETFVFAPCRGGRFIMLTLRPFYLGALQRLQVIHAATHDSIGMGEDGPTHQPIELAALYRAMPNLLFFRPGDNEETAGAWIAAVEAKETPSIISTSRHAVPQVKGTSREGVSRGAYVLQENKDAVLTLIGVGAELSHAVNVQSRLKEAHGIEARVVSFPCQRLFINQPLAYQRDILRRDKMPAFVIEPYTSNGWERFADGSASINRFGHSLPGKAAYKYFGFDTESLTAKVMRYLEMIKEDPLLKQEFVECL